MEIADVVEGCVPDAEVCVSVRADDVSSKGWDFYVAVSSDGNENEYSLLRGAERLDAEAGVGESKNYRRVLKVGDFLFPGEEKHHFATALSTQEQFAKLIGYLGVDAGGQRMRSGELVCMYRQVSELVAKLAEKGCKVKFGGEPEKAERLAGLYELFKQQD
jgi:hypothetical protein